MSGRGRRPSRTRRGAKTLRRLAALAAALALAACGRGEIGAPQYAADQCRRLALVDAATGEPVVGAEDIALDPARGRVFISAYDRRAVEKAARRNADAPPQGGVYTVSLAALFDPEMDVLSAAPLIAPENVAGGLRPHGLAYDTGKDEVIFINRAYVREKGKWTMTPRLHRVGADAQGLDDGAPAFCAANNVVATARQTFTTFDHGACGWRGGLEAVFNLKRSGVALEAPGAASQRVYDRAGFANGLTLTDKGDIVMAATRENALLLMRELSGGVQPVMRIATPGGPDNLTLSHDGGVVAAVHPSLRRLALNRKLGVGKAPSRIVKADVATGAVEILFDDPSGDLFSAATVAVETADGLILGSVTDAGLLVCRAAS